VCEALRWYREVRAHAEQRIEQRGAVAFAVVIFIALVIAVWGLF
jgi:hypothetical protein